ncbi:hypothetical protein ACHAXS_010740 [Conticribra weissflogii]
MMNVASNCTTHTASALTSPPYDMTLSNSLRHHDMAILKSNSKPKSETKDFAVIMEKEVERLLHRHLCLSNDD